MKSRLRIVLIGAAEQKQKIMQDLRKELPKSQSPQTIGIDFVTVEHKNESYSIWDTAGTERFGSSLLNAYAKNADVVIYANPNSHQRNITLNDKTVSFDYDSSLTILQHLEKAKTAIENRRVNPVKQQLQGVREQEESVKSAMDFRNIL